MKRERTSPGKHDDLAGMLLAGGMQCQAGDGAAPEALSERERIVIEMISGAYVVVAEGE